jgi:hypothetical protein
MDGYRAADDQAYLREGVTMHRFTKTRGRKIASITTALVLLLCGAAFAYFIILESGEGVSHKTLGKATATGEHLTLEATFANGLTPGKHVPIALAVTNNTKQASDVRLETITPSIDAAHAAAGCDIAWFKIAQDGFAKWTELTKTGMSTPIQVAVGQTVKITSGEGSEPELEMEETGTNQSACEGAEVTLTMTSQP